MMYTILDGIGGGAAIDRPDTTAAAPREDGGFARVFDDVAREARDAAPPAAADASARAETPAEAPVAERAGATAAAPDDSPREVGAAPTDRGPDAVEGAREGTTASGDARATELEEGASAAPSAPRADARPVDAASADTPPDAGEAPEGSSAAALVDDPETAASSEDDRARLEAEARAAAMMMTRTTTDVAPERVGLVAAHEAPEATLDAPGARTVDAATTAPTGATASGPTTTRSAAESTHAGTPAPPNTAAGETIGGVTPREDGSRATAANATQAEGAADRSMRPAPIDTQRAMRAWRAAATGAALEATDAAPAPMTAASKLARDDASTTATTTTTATTATGARLDATLDGEVAPTTPSTRAGASANAGGAPVHADADGLAIAGTEAMRPLVDAFEAALGARPERTTDLDGRVEVEGERAVGTPTPVTPAGAATNTAATPVRAGEDANTDPASAELRPLDGASAPKVRSAAAEVTAELASSAPGAARATPTPETEVGRAAMTQAPSAEDNLQRAPASSRVEADVLEPTQAATPRAEPTDSPRAAAQPAPERPTPEARVVDAEPLAATTAGRVAGPAVAPMPADAPRAALAPAGEAAISQPTVSTASASSGLTPTPAPDEDSARAAEAVTAREVPRVSNPSGPGVTRVSMPDVPEAATPAIAIAAQPMTERRVDATVGEPEARGDDVAPASSPATALAGEPTRRRAIPTVSGVDVTSEDEVSSRPTRSADADAGAAGPRTKQPTSSVLPARAPSSEVLADLAAPARRTQAESSAEPTATTLGTTQGTTPTAAQPVRPNPSATRVAVEPARPTPQEPARPATGGAFVSMTDRSAPLRAPARALTLEPTGAPASASTPSTPTVPPAPAATPALTAVPTRLDGMPAPAPRPSLEAKLEAKLDRSTLARLDAPRIVDPTAANLPGPELETQALERPEPSVGPATIDPAARGDLTRTEAGDSNGSPADERARDDGEAPSVRRRERRSEASRGLEGDARFAPAPTTEPKLEQPIETQATAHDRIAEAPAANPHPSGPRAEGPGPSGAADATPALRAYAEPRADDGMPSGQLGPRRAAITLGEGEERVTLAVDASAGRVTVEATASSPGVARALAEYRGELREALRGHGLELGGFSASTGGGQPAPQREGREDRGAAERDDPRDPHRAHAAEATPRGVGRRPGVRVVA